MPSSNALLIQTALPEEVQNAPEEKISHIPYVLRFGEIVKLLRGDARKLYTDPDIDYAHTLCNDLEALVAFLQNPSKIQEIKAFFQSFETLEDISGKKLVNFIRMLHAMEDSERDEGGFTLHTYADVEILRSVFLTFGLLQTENVSGQKKKGKNPLLNLYANKKEGIPLRPFYIDGGAMTDFFPDEDRSETQVFTTVKDGISITDGSIIPSIIPEVQSEVQEAVAQVLTEEAPEPSSADVPQSDFQRGAQRRRTKDREKKASLLEARTLRSEREIFLTEYGKYQNLHAFLSGQIDRLRDFLLRELPYVQELLYYIELQMEREEKTQELAYYEQLLVDDDKRSEPEIERAIAELEQALQELEKERGGRRSSGRRAGGEIIEDEGSIVGSGKSRERGLNIQIRGLRIAIDKERRKLSRKKRSLEKKENWEQTVQQLESDIHALSNLIASQRIKHIPNTDEFVDGFYAVLGAGNYAEIGATPSMYIINEEWIEDNIVPIFRGLFEKISETLRKNHSIAGLTILEIFETLDTIESIDPLKTESPLPELSKGVSMKKVKAYMDVFLEAIPRVSLISYPEHIRPKKEPRKRKTHSNKRAEEKIASQTRQSQKVVITGKLRDTEIRLEGFRQHWEKRYKELKRSIFRINNAIDIARMGKKGHDDLLAQKTTKEQELKTIEIHMQDTNLIDHALGFDDLMKERADLQRKLQRIKN